MRDEIADDDAAAAADDAADCNDATHDDGDPYFKPPRTLLLSAQIHAHQQGLSNPIPSSIWPGCGGVCRERDKGVFLAVFIRHIEWRLEDEP